MAITRNAATRHTVRYQTVDLLPVRYDRKVVFLKLDDIDWIQAADNYVTLQVGKQSHLLRGTLNSIELRLPADRFVRISRFRIVQIDRIKELDLLISGDCRAKLHDGSKMIVSRRYRSNFQKKGLL
jgi:two-component system LytT family response regulator